MVCDDEPMEPSIGFSSHRVAPRCQYFPRQFLIPPSYPCSMLKVIGSSLHHGGVGPNTSAASRPDAQHNRIRINRRTRLCDGNRTLLRPTMAGLLLGIILSSISRSSTASAQTLPLAQTPAISPVDRLRTLFLSGRRLRVMIIILHRYSSGYHGTMAHHARHGRGPMHNLSGSACRPPGDAPRLERHMAAPAP